MEKILLEIRGGVLISTKSTTADVRVSLLDYDDDYVQEAIQDVELQSRGDIDTYIAERELEDLENHDYEITHDDPGEF